MKLAVLRPNAEAGPTTATRRPVSGARTIYDNTAAVQTALLAATISRSATTEGSTLLATGLKSAATPTDRPNATT